MTDSDSDNRSDFNPTPCPTCGIPFPNSRAVRTHHYNAHGESLVKVEIRECKRCGEEFEYEDNSDKSGLFCSRPCANKWRSENPDRTAYGD